MSPDLAETAVAEPAGTLSAAGDLGLSAPLARLRADSARMDAVRDVWKGIWMSRLLVWSAAVGTIAVLGFGPVRRVFDPPGSTRGFGWLGDVLAAPAARWDAAWYLTIAHYGYRPDLGTFTAPRDAFFPLYPIGLRALSDLGTPPLLAGVLLSLAALAFGLYALHRLTTLEAARLRLGRGRELARLTVLTCAFGPMAFFFSAVYSESLYLALSVGAFLFARRGRWPLAAACAGLAAATRSSGVALALPLALLYLYGPRDDRRPDRECHRLQPRYRLRADLLWLLLVPAGIVAYGVYLGLAGGDPLAPFHAQAGWSRHFAGPFGGAWTGVLAGLRAVGHAGTAASHNLVLLAFLAVGAVGLVGVLRLLPFAYGAYVLAALALPLSYPVSSQPLMSLPRFLLVLFPLNIWLGTRLLDRPWLTRALLGGSGVALAFFTGAFSTWHWVA
ncbi:MAG TPA: mannosyltransferase family protein [Solirubrobacteraceae bacterium]|nr:mannosyltransferase family protein [Solirubrobacteraceae bacterium]